MYLKNKNNFFLKPLSALLLMSSFSQANISGTVFKDFNLNGQKDTEDTAVLAAQVKAVCEDGSTPSTVTDVNGFYSIPVATGGNKCRIEVDANHVGMKSGANGEGSSTPLVDIVLDGQTHDVSVASSASYCQANPDVLMAAMPGKLDSDGNLLPNLDLQGSLFKVVLPADGEHSGSDTIDDKRTKLTAFSDTGAVWGLAYKKSTSDIFAASTIKRFVPLKDDGTDTGKIYKIDSSTTLSLFATIPNAGNVAVDRDYTGNQDEATKVLIGRKGLGDLDISEDETKLYTVNMNTKSLITMDSISGNILSTTVIPNPYGTDCSDDMVRPWALKVLGENIYIGSVCENGIESGVGASIQKYNGTSFSELARTNTLLYLRPRPGIYGDADTSPQDSSQYHNWSEGNSRSFQPMLTDIEFSNKGDLVLGYTGRQASMRVSTIADGDIRKMCLNQDGSYTDESTAVVPTDCESHTANYRGNTDDTYYEFYTGDEYTYADNDTFDGHPETASGAMAQAPGRNNIVVGMVDATAFNEPGGLGLYDHTSGAKIATQAVLKNDTIANGGEREYYGAKAGGLGDVELLCDPAPIEIGNYVWEDTDGDGIQDPEEPALSGVSVKLYNETGVLQGTATTDPTGHYYFGGMNNINMAGISLNTNTIYKLSIDISDANGNPPTQANVNANNDDIRDNDAILDGITAVISFNTSTQNNHSLDFGFLSKPKVSIGSLVWEDLNNNGLQDDDENGIKDVNVTLLDENGIVLTTPVMQTTGVDGKYYFSGLDEGSYSVMVSVPSNMGYVPCGNQTSVDNNDTENDSNIKSSSGNEHTSGKFSLVADNEPEEGNAGMDGINGTDEADVDDDNNGNMTVDFCFYRPASLGDYVWKDSNKDGVQDSNETGVSGVRVTLLKDCNAGTVEGTTTTDENGTYLFSGLDAGDYCVEFSDLPVDYIVTTQGGGSTSDSDASEIAPFKTAKTTLDAGENDLSWDMGIYSSKATIGDLVWYDLNGNGEQESGERGVVGISVKLLDATCNNELNTTTTDASGHYIFESLEANSYCIAFGDLPNGYGITQKNNASSSTDSDVDPITHKTIATVLDAGEDDMTWDMGIYPLAELGDKVWSDNNANGVQDAGENGVVSVTVTLYNADCTTRAKSVDGVTDVATSITSGAGEYKFSDLVQGDYCVGFSNIPNGYLVSPQDKSGNDAVDSDVNADTNTTTVISLDANGSDMTWDMGIYQPATIGDKVWNDINANGIQDAGEVGVENVTVTLYDASCNVTAVDVAGASIPTETTDASGNYLFEGLVPAEYCVGFTTLPVGYAISPQSVGANDAVNSDVNVTTAKTVVTTLDPAEDDRTWDMGIYQEASIGNYVWNDANANGEQEGTEDSVADVTVTLYKADCITVAIDSKGSNIPTIQTDANGIYLFEHLMPNEYCIGFTTLPAGFGFTAQDSVADDAKDSDVDPLTGKTTSTILDAGEADMSWDAGIFQASSIGDIVWNDKNANGIQDAGEIGVKDVTVKLYKGDCSTPAVDGKNVAIADRITDEDGQYVFSSLVPNDYCVGFDLNTIPRGYKVSPQTVRITADKDSNADITTGLTVSTTLIGGENDSTWDMGIYSPASIGDRVWLDANADGVQDDNETGVNNVTVTLFKSDCTTVVTLDNDGEVVTPISTDLNGNYMFTNLVPAEYCVGFTNLPANHVVSPKDNGAEDKDSDVNPATMKTVVTTLESGENDPTWDMGIYVPASIGDRVWHDENGNGLQDTNETSVENVNVTLYKGDCSTVVSTDDSGVAIAVQKTDVNGLYNFSNLTPNDYCVGFELPIGYVVTSKDSGSDNEKDSDVNPATVKTDSTTLSSGENDPTWDMGIYKPASIGNRVWNDKNGDGVQDSGEEGVDGVAVNLYACDCITPALTPLGVEIAAVMTDANGVYTFNNLQPNKYCVGFTPLEGYVVSPQSSTEDDAKDSDVNKDTNKTECTTLSSDENDTTWDMGIYIPASVGDRIWYDTNRDGIQDMGELGVSNAWVTLYTPDSIVVATTQTDEDGNFLFDELVPNDYVLGFKTPDGYAISDSNKTNDNNDSDVDAKTGKTEVINLESGESDISWDAGIYQLSTLGDKVWYDENHNGIQDVNEPAVKNVKVTLYASDCSTAIAETRSNQEGKYLFEDLKPNDYCVGFDDLPIGYQFTPNYDNTGAGSELDCNVDPGTGKTPIIVLPHATNDMTWDMGIIPKCKDEQDRVLRIYDDNITASITGSVTRINILANDHGNLDIESIRFVSTQEGAILWENGTAVGGTTLKTSDKLVVEGEGNWTITNSGIISFKAESGFTGVPTPVYYIINCKQGSTSNVAKIEITSNCVCDTYEQSASDSVSALNNWAMLVIFLMISGLGSLLIQREFKEQ